MLSFRSLSLASCALTASLSVVLAFASGLIFWLFAVEETASALFIGRRASVMFFGLALLFWLGRGAGPSHLRQAVCLAMAAMMAGLALLGLGEFLRGFAGVGIFLAVLTEAVFAAAFLQIWRWNRSITM